MTVIGNTTFVLGDAVFLGSPMTATVTEAGDVWDPATLTVNVGDMVTWVWASNTSLVEVDVLNRTMSGGVASSAGRGFFRRANKC